MSKSDPAPQKNYIAYSEEAAFNLYFFVMKEKGAVSKKLQQERTYVLEEI